jgi:hypothetical protein
MEKHKEIKKLIERALASCTGSGMREVRLRLESSLAALERVKAERKARQQTSSPQWSLDLSSGSLRNLTRSQAQDAISKIEQMIGAERKRISYGDEEVIMG